MILTQENAFLKAHEELRGLIAYVQEATGRDERIDQVERGLMGRLLALGLTLLESFVALQGDGDRGPEVETDSGRVLRRLEEPHDRRYVSIFGALNISRVVYGTREGQQIELVPLDGLLALPEGDFSYVLQDWQQRLCIKESFAEAAESLHALLGLRIGSRTAEHMNQAMARDVIPFREATAPPPAAEEGPILVVTADGKGVPMRRPPADEPKRRHCRTRDKKVDTTRTRVLKRHHRRTKGEKADKKQMSCVGAVYSIDPFVRTPEDILDEVFRELRSADRPVPVYKHVWAELSRDLDGEPLGAKDAVFCAMFDELSLRNLGDDRPVVCLMDGEHALWEAQRVYFPEAVGILDLFHVMERLWTAAHCFHAEGSAEAEEFVEARLRDLLQGRVGYVIGGLRQRLTKHGLRGARAQRLTAVITYFENNREHMRYDEYLAAGYPIGSGVAEGACRHLVKDRMEGTGMRWTVVGAQAMLHLRAVYLNDQWDDFIEERIQREQLRLYGKDAA